METLWNYNKQYKMQQESASRCNFFKDGGHLLVFGRTEDDGTC